MHKPTLEPAQNTEPRLVREIIRLCNLLHPRITPVSHRHKITNVRKVRKVVSHMAHSVHDAFVLVLDTEYRPENAVPSTYSDARCTADM